MRNSEQAETVEVASASPTTEALARLARSGPQGNTWKLSEQTSFAWDEVHYFPEGSRREEVRAATRSQLFGDRTGLLLDRGSLLVFTREGRVVEAVWVLPPVHLSSDGARFSASEATLRAHSKPPPPHLLVLE